MGELGFLTLSGIGHLEGHPRASPPAGEALGDVRGWNWSLHSWLLTSPLSFRG